MPRHPERSALVGAMPGSVFSALAHRLATYEGEVYPFHVGDTWLEPPEGCRMEDLTVAENPGMHRYAPPQGLPALRETVAAHVARRDGVATSADDVLITAGATGALGAAVAALADPGDEVRIHSPYWPLIPGIVRAAHATPVEVASGARDRSPVSDRTVAIYLATPNNPDGVVADRVALERVVEVARAHDLWLLTDEVYDEYVYDGEFVSLRALAPERTIAVGSCSKRWGMAGNRCGWAVGPSSAIVELCKVSTHAFYNCPTASQLAALRAFEGRGDRWVSAVRPRYEALGREAARRLGVGAPDGGQFLFLDVARRLDDRGLLGLLEDAADRGLFLAPGPSFGSGYEAFVRLCFTAASPDVTRRGLDVLASLLGR